MFGNMFDESTTSMAKEKSKPKTLNNIVIEEPPLERGGKHLIGIRNQGATCYLNSLLQTLFFTPEFREQLFCIRPEELGKVRGKDKDLHVKVRKIPVQLQLLLARLLLLDQDSCTTHDLTESFGWQNQEQFQQHDVQELSRILFDAIENSLIGTSGQKLIPSLFKGSIVNQTQCCSCNRISERQEEFLDITVSVAGETSLEKALSAMYQSEEYMCGKNQYFCEQCRKLVNARKGAKLGSVPPILTISLLRFNFDPRTFSRYKETSHFSFPIKLDIGRYRVEKEEKECTEYVLYSVIIHKGNAHRGHYHAYIRDVDGLGHSDIPVSDADYEPDFSQHSVKATLPEGAVLRNPPSSHSAASENAELGAEEMLACLIAQGDPPKVSELGKIFHKETGVSWNKKFRKKHGSIAKFLRSCSDTFEVDTENDIVLLKDTATVRVDHAVFSAASNQKNHVIKDDVSKVKDTDHLSNGLTNKEDSSSSSSTDGAIVNDQIEDSCHDCVEMGSAGHRRLGACWFNVNDETIKPISVHSIPGQFSGQQSAYMLFYRRKDLARPEESWENVTYNVPRHIQDAVELENEDLLKWREKYDLALNRLDLHIHTEAMCCRQDQLLKPFDRDGFVLRIDRRKTIEDLKSDVFDNLPKMTRRKKKQKLLVSQTADAFDLPEPRYTRLHTVKFLDHGGMHLYDCVTEQPDVTLAEAGLVTEMHLFLWDGESIFGRPVTCGEESEPVSVTLLCLVGDNLEAELVFAATKSSCFETAVRCASCLLDCSADEMQLERSVTFEGDDGEKTDGFDLFPGVNDCPCRYLEVFRASHLLRENSRKTRCRNSNEENKEPPIRVKVKNSVVKPNDDNPAFLTDAIYTVTVPSTTNVAELKSAMCKVLSLDKDAMRVCYSHLDDHYPLRASDELQSLDLGLDHLFVIEEGREPARDEMIVYVKQQNGGQFVELVVSQSTKLPALMGDIQEMFSLTDTVWHLVRCNCYGEKLGNIDCDKDDDIVKCGIHHKQYVSVCPGKTTQKDVISIKLLRYPPRPLLREECSRTNVHDYLAEQQQTCDENESFSSLKQWTSIDTLDSLEPVSIGQFDLKKEETLYELWEHIVKSVGDGHKQDEMHVLVRVVEKSELGRVVHFNDKTSTLKRLKLQPSANLSVQLIDSDVWKKETEALSNRGKDHAVFVIVNVQFHLPGTRAYTEPLELVCDPNPSKLPSLLANALDVSVDELLVARKSGEKFTWSELRAEAAQPSGSKSKSVKKGKSSAKRKSVSRQSKDNAPAPLKDADVIGVKLIDEEKKIANNPIPLNDFDSKDDLLQRERLAEREKLSESSRLSTPPDNRRSDAAQCKSTKKGEAALKIHVDNFADDDKEDDGGGGE